MRNGRLGVYRKRVLRIRDVRAAKTLDRMDSEFRRASEGHACRLPHLSPSSTLNVTGSLSGSNFRSSRQATSLPAHGWFGRRRTANERPALYSQCPRDKWPRRRPPGLQPVTPPPNPASAPAPTAHRPPHRQTTTTVVTRPRATVPFGFRSESFNDGKPLHHAEKRGRRPAASAPHAEVQEVLEAVRIGAAGR